MKHTECKNCEFSKGDCGYHFKMDGTTNYDIASLSACDQYCNCMFFKSKAKPKYEWIIDDAGNITCSNCGFSLGSNVVKLLYPFEFTYCPDCGKKVRHK